MFSGNDILKGAVGYLLVLFLSFVLGYAIQQLASIRKPLSGEKGTLSIFWKLLAGTMLLISAYAIFITKGITIFLINPILIFLFVREKLKYETKKDFIEEQQSKIFFGITVLFNFLFYWWAFSSSSNDNIFFTSGDFNIYFRIAHLFNIKGIENSSLDPIYTSAYAAPYHYGDVWMYAIIIKFISTNPSIVFLVAFSHFSVIFLNGIYLYVSKLFSSFLGNRRNLLYIFLFAGLFTGFNIFFPKFILPSSEPYTLSVMNWAKVLVPSSMLIGLLIIAKEKNWLSFVLLAMIGGLSFINALPAIFLSVFLFLLFNVLTGKITVKYWFYLHLCYVLITVSFVVFLYKILPQLLGVIHQNTNNTISVFDTMDIKHYFKTAMNIFIGGWFQLFVLTPYFIILFISILLTGKLKNIKQHIYSLDSSILLLFLFLFSGLFCWALLHNFDVNSVQFFSNILSPFAAILISLITAYTLFVVRNKIVILFSIVIISMCIVSHKNDMFFITQSDKKEWTKLQLYLNDKKANCMFVNLKSMKTFDAFFEKYTTIFIPLNFLNYRWSNYQNISLNAPFIPINSKSAFLAEESNVINSAPFMVYYKDKQDKYKNNIDSITLQFIKEYKIGYVSVSKDTSFPTNLRHLIKDSIVLNKFNFVVYRLQ